MVLPIDPAVLSRWPGYSSEQRRGLLRVLDRLSLEAPLSKEEAAGLGELQRLAVELGLESEIERLRVAQ